jgi:hypothetical protein
VKLFLLLLVSVAFVFAVDVPKTPVTAPKAPVTAPKATVAQPKEAYEAGFDKIKGDYAKKAGEIEKARKNNQDLAKKAVSSDSLLKVQQDSSIIVAKNLLKVSYDAEMEKIVSQINVLKTKQAKLDSLYKEAVSTFDKK